MPLTALSPDRLAELAPIRKQLRDVPGVTESRPGVFVVARATVIEMFDSEGRGVARLNPQGHGNAELFWLDDAVKRRSLIDALRLRIKRLADD
jgi:hypothetical protein